MINILIAIAAGGAAGLMFASIISGALISLVLLNLAPLPLMVAALGWGPASALVGAVTAGTGLGFAFGFAYAAAFIIMVGVPALWLGYLALLAQPADPTTGLNGSTPAAPALEWYPPGRLLLWIAVCGFLIALSALLTLGTDHDTIMAALRGALKRMVAAQGGVGPVTGTDEALDVAMLLAPAVATVGMIFTLTLNLWLSGKVVLKSGRLPRPWPDLRSIELPPATIIAFGAALALSFTGGLVAMLAQMAGAALGVAYMLVGFAVLHSLSPLFGGRWGLAGAYAAILMSRWWLLLAVVLLGLVESTIGLRGRFANRTKPPTLPT
jgi:hypothetical protein